jgi:hypothetical protein
MRGMAIVQAAEVHASVLHGQNAPHRRPAFT